MMTTGNQRGARSLYDLDSDGPGDGMSRRALEGKGATEDGRGCGECGRVARRLTDSGLTWRRWEPLGAGHACAMTLIS